MGFFQIMGESLIIDTHRSYLCKVQLDNYGINSTQTNQMMTTACVIVNYVQPEQFT